MPNLLGHGRRLLTTNEFRGLSPVQKGIKLIEDYNVTFIKAAEICGVSKSKIQRAKQAENQGREPGINGRSILLKHSEEVEVLKILQTKTEINEVVIEEAQREVNNFHSTLNY